MNAYNFFPWRCQAYPNEVRVRRCTCVSITTEVHCETVALIPETVHVDLVAGTEAELGETAKIQTRESGPHNGFFEERFQTFNLRSYSRSRRGRAMPCRHSQSRESWEFFVRKRRHAKAVSLSGCYSCAARR